MKFEKSSPEFMEFFAKIAPVGPDIEQKKVFGYPACFVNGNMFTGLHGNSMILRLGETERQQFMQMHEAHIFEPMPGHSMKEYVVVPQSVLDDKTLLTSSIAKSLDYARTLPPKIKKPKKA